MSYTPKQKKRYQWSTHIRKWFGKNDYSMQLDAENRGVEKRKRPQFRTQKTKE